MIQFVFCSSGQDVSESTVSITNAFLDERWQLLKPDGTTVLRNAPTMPVTMNEEGVVLVSGATPRLFSMAAGGNLSPYAFMMEVVKSPRYREISA